MNLEETTMLLTKIAAFDRRTIGEADVLAWHEVLGDLPLADCASAVRDHFRDTSDWCMPSHIVSRVEALHSRRTREIGIYPDPNVELEDVERDGYLQVTAESTQRRQEEFQELLHRIRHGLMDRAAYDAYKASGLPLAEFESRKAVRA